MRNTTGGQVQPGGGDASPFDKIKHTDERGDYWLARELMPLLGYRKWEKFEDSIERARVSIATTGMDPDAEASRRREAYGRTRQVGANYRLTRHGAFITAMNGDVRKPEIAAAQAYFAIKTHEAETRASSAVALPQDYEEALEELLVKVREVRTLQSQNDELGVRADTAEHRADTAERKFAEFEGGPGITLTKFHKKYFSEVPARVFFEHLYAKGYLIDQRGQGPWDEKNQCYKDGPQHFEPSFRGKPFLYLHEAGVFRKKRRFKTLVRPGDPELSFKHRLIADGLRGNAHTTDYLFAIEGGR
jgi:hypothetical protein